MCSHVFVFFVCWMYFTVKICFHILGIGSVMQSRADLVLFLLCGFGSCSQSRYIDYIDRIYSTKQNKFEFVASVLGMDYYKTSCFIRTSPYTGCLYDCFADIIIIITVKLG